MLFITGLTQLTKDEKLLLIAQIQTYSTKKIVAEGFLKFIKWGRDQLEKGMNIFAENFEEDLEVMLKNAVKNVDWDSDYLQMEIKRNYEKQKDLSEEQVDRLLFTEMLTLSGLKGEVKPEILANKILHNVADEYKLKTYESVSYTHLTLPTKRIV